MRILILSDVYFPRVNGVSTSIRTFRREFLARGHKVTLIAPDYEDGQVDDDLDIIRIPSHQLSFDPEDRRMQRAAIRRLVGRLHEQNYDIIHIHTPFVAHYAGLHLAGKLGVPVIESYHTFFEEYLFNYIRWLPKDPAILNVELLNRRHRNNHNNSMVDSRRGQAYKTLGNSNQFSRDDELPIPTDYQEIYLR